MAEEFGGPQTDALKSAGDGLLELHISSDLPLGGIADRLGSVAGSEQAVARQKAIFQIDVETSRGLVISVQMMPVDLPPISGCVKLSTIMRQFTNLPRAQWLA